MWQHNLVTTKPCAFFDVDNTLISIKSMFSFMNYLQRESNLISAELIDEVDVKLKYLFAESTPRAHINEYYYSLFNGISVNALVKEAQTWSQSVCGQDDFFHQHTLARLRHHQEEGYNIVFVSGSGLAMLLPLAEQLNVNAILCAPQTTAGGKYMGTLYDLPCIGEGKAHYISHFFQQFDNVDVSESSVAYGDDISDFPMLDSVGKGCLVNPEDKTLLANKTKYFSVLTAGVVR